MERQIVNAQGITVASDRLKGSNNNINEAFNKMESRVLRDLETWRSPAGESAQTTMYQLLKHNDERSKVLQNYFNMLMQQVNPNYKSAETTNTSLADKFK